MVSEMEAVKTNSVNNSAYLASQVTQHTAQSVGVEFVRQYYTMLNVAPGLLYRYVIVYRERERKSEFV